MDKITKALKKLTEKERRLVSDALEQLRSGKTANPDVKKLKGRNDIFRVRKGNIRIIYKAGKNISVLSIERRRENTYKF